MLNKLSWLDLLDCQLFIQLWKAGTDYRVNVVSLVLAQLQFKKQLLKFGFQKKIQVSGSLNFDVLKLGFSCKLVHS